METHRSTGRAARDTHEASLRGDQVAPLSFEILHLERVNFGSKKATGRVAIAGFGWLNIELFCPEGREPFVAAESIRNKFTGAWCKSARFDGAFAASLLEAVLAALDDS